MNQANCGVNSCLSPRRSAQMSRMYTCGLFRARARTHSAPHSLHLLLSRWCWQMLAPPHSVHLLLRRWCGQMLAPPHSLHLLLRRWCGQRFASAVLASSEAGIARAPSRHSLHLLLRRWCWQRLAPPHSLHWLLMR